MKTPVKIGFLTPYSGIYPYYAQHMTAGMSLGLGLHGSPPEVQIMPAYTHMGGAKQNEAAARQLLFFDQVDILSGLISYRSVIPLIPLLESLKKIGFFFDMGDYLPYFPQLSPNVFYCSQQLWQSEYALGRWARQQFGPDGMMLTPVYEAGYHLDKAFRKGTLADGRDGAIRQHLLPYDERTPGNLELQPFFEEIKHERPAFVHVIFAGAMGSRFLHAWRQSELYGHIPLLVNETMAYEDMLEDVRHLGLEMYAPSLWSRSSEDPHNQRFVRQFESMTGTRANVYALQGYEAGLALKELWPQIERRDWEAVKTLLQKEVIRGPRGDRNFYPASGFALPDTDIVKISTDDHGIRKMVIDRGQGLKHDIQELEEIHQGCVSGWQNPFLCI